MALDSEPSALKPAFAMLVAALIVFCVGNELYSGRFMCWWCLKTSPLGLHRASVAGWSLFMVLIANPSCEVQA